MIMNTLKEKLGSARTTAVDFLRWIILAIITGFVVGGVGILFVKGLGLANAFRNAHSWIILTLPLAGLLIVFLYKVSNYENDKHSKRMRAKSHPSLCLYYYASSIVSSIAVVLSSVLLMTITNLNSYERKISQCNSQWCQGK